MNKEELRKVIEGRGHASRVPLMVQFWVNPEVFGERRDDIARLIQRYPCDIDIASLQFPQVKYTDTPPDAVVWNQKSLDVSVQQQGYDNRIVLEDWEELDTFLAEFPEPTYDGMIPKLEPTEKYRLATWWYCLFERLWELRGMENALMDFYLYPDEVHRLLQKLTDFYMAAMERTKNELDADGIFVSDDIGTQTGPFFSPEIFRTFFKPYYEQLFGKAHQLGMHFWLHSCGNIEALLPDLIGAGLDVIHPIQKYTMDDERIAKAFGDRICIWYGFDVQQIIPFGTPQEVRQEVRRIMDVFKRKDGRFMLTMGNGSTADWPTESLEALFDESMTYGRFDEIGRVGEEDVRTHAAD